MFLVISTGAIKCYLMSGSGRRRFSLPGELSSPSTVALRLIKCSKTCAVRGFTATLYCRHVSKCEDLADNDFAVPYDSGLVLASLNWQYYVKRTIARLGSKQWGLRYVYKYRRTSADYFVVYIVARQRILLRNRRRVSHR